MQRPHICREHFVTISICCFKTCLGLFCAGSFGVSCSCSCSCLYCHCCCLGGVGGIGFALAALLYRATWLCFIFFWKCIRFALGQYLPTTTTRDKCQNLNWFIAVLRFFLEQTGSLIWSLSTDDCAVSDSSASAVRAASKLQRLEVIKRSNWEWGFSRCQGYGRAWRVLQAGNQR